MLLLTLPSVAGFKLSQADLNCTFVIFPSQGKCNIAGIRSSSYMPSIARRMEMLSPYVAHSPDDEEE